MNTPSPQSLCLEDLDALTDRERFLCCVALAGRRPGLGFDDQGRVRWEASGSLCCELWVTADSRLALYRRPGGAEVLVSRAGRSLKAPSEKPVILLDGDTLELGGRRLRLHLHGPTEAASPPRYFAPEESGLGSVVRAAAAALAIGTASLTGAAGCAGGEPRESAREWAERLIEVRSRPPDVHPAREPGAQPDAGAGADASKTRPPPIEVRHQPPAVPVLANPPDMGTPDPKEPKPR